MPAPVAAWSVSGKSPHRLADPRPSCSITMVGASAGAGPIMRYSRSHAPMVRKPVGERVVMTATLPAAFQARSLPPCGGGLGRGVSHIHRIRGYPPLRLSPARGERAERRSQRALGIQSTIASWLRRISIPQLEALDLPGRRLRQGLHHFDPTRILPRADLL